MIKITTQNDILRYVYNETSSEENKQIENKIICGDGAADEFYQTTATKQLLDETLYEAPQSAVDAILSVSKLYDKIEAAK